MREPGWAWPLAFRLAIKRRRLSRPVAARLKEAGTLAADRDALGGPVTPAPDRPGVGLAAQPNRARR